MRSRWHALAKAGVNVAVLATAVPKCTALAFLEACQPPGDTFTLLEYGDLWDIVVYRDNMLQHEVAKNVIL